MPLTSLGKNLLTGSKNLAARGLGKARDVVLGTPGAAWRHKGKILGGGALGTLAAAPYGRGLLAFAEDSKPAPSMPLIDKKPQAGSREEIQRAVAQSVPPEAVQKTSTPKPTIPSITQAKSWLETRPNWQKGLGIGLGSLGGGYLLNKLFAGKDEDDEESSFPWAGTLGTLGGLGLGAHYLTGGDYSKLVNPDFWKSSAFEKQAAPSLQTFRSTLTPWLRETGRRGGVLARPGILTRSKELGQDVWQRAKGSWQSMTPENRDLAMFGAGAGVATPALLATQKKSMHKEAGPRDWMNWLLKGSPRALKPVRPAMPASLAERGMLGRIPDKPKLPSTPAWQTDLGPFEAQVKGRQNWLQRAKTLEQESTAYNRAMLDWERQMAQWGKGPKPVSGLSQIWQNPYTKPGLTGVGALGTLGTLSSLKGPEQVEPLGAVRGGTEEEIGTARSADNIEGAGEVRTQQGVPGPGEARGGTVAGTGAARGGTGDGAGVAREVPPPTPGLFDRIGQTWQGMPTWGKGLAIGAPLALGAYGLHSYLKKRKRRREEDDEDKEASYMPAILIPRTVGLVAQPTQHSFFRQEAGLEKVALPNPMNLLKPLMAPARRFALGAQNPAGQGAYVVTGGPGGAFAAGQRAGATPVLGAIARNPIKSVGGAAIAGTAGKGIIDETRARGERSQMEQEQGAQAQRAEEQFQAAQAEQAGQTPGQVTPPPAAPGTQPPTAQQPPTTQPGQTPGQAAPQPTTPGAAKGPGAQPPTQQATQQAGQQAQQATQQAQAQHGAQPGQPPPPQAQQQGVHNIAQQAPPEVKQQGPQGIMDWASNLWNAIPEGMRWPLVGGLGLGALSLLSGGLGGGGGEGGGGGMLGGLGPLLGVGGLGLGGYAAYKGGLFDQFLPQGMQSGGPGLGGLLSAFGGAPAQGAPPGAGAPPVPGQPGAPGTQPPGMAPGGQQGAQIPGAPGQPPGQPSTVPVMTPQVTQALGSFRQTLSGNNPMQTMTFLRDNVLKMSPQDQQAAMSQLSDQEWNTLQAHGDQIASQYGGLSSDAARAPAMITQKRQEAMQLRQNQQAQTPEGQVQIQQAVQQLQQQRPDESQNTYQAIAGVSPLSKEFWSTAMDDKQTVERLRQEVAKQQNIAPDKVADKQIIALRQQISNEIENAEVKAHLADTTGLGMDKITPDMVASTRNQFDRERIREGLAERRGEKPEQISDKQITRWQQHEKENPSMASSLGKTGIGMAAQKGLRSTVQIGAGKLLGAALPKGLGGAATGVIGDVADRLGIMPEWLGGDPSGSLTPKMLRDRLDAATQGTFGASESPWYRQAYERPLSALSGALEGVSHPLTTMQAGGQKVQELLGTPTEQKYYNRPIDLNIFGKGGPAAWWNRVDMPINPKKWLPF